MSEEKQRILKMLEEGKLTVEQAMALLERIESSPEASGSEAIAENLSDADTDATTPTTSFAMTNPFPGEKMLLIRVLSADGDKVNVNLPLNLVKGIIKATGKMPYISSEMEGVDINAMMETILAAIEADLAGRFVDVETVQGDKVVIEIT